jgi:phosphatidylserine/phosphatidylglycerophosphate/cardiolipin synthase-like enzyme
MAQFLNTAAAYSEIENIINRAEKNLVLVSPYVRLPRVLSQRILHAGQSRGVHVIIVCRKKDLPPEESAAFRKISWLEVLDLPNLHAKCFYNEKSMVITSLNLYGYSPVNNREIGVLLTMERDPDAFKDAVNEAESMIQTSYQLEAGKMMARQRQVAEDVSIYDIAGGLKRSFPTFAKILSRR